MFNWLKKAFRKKEQEIAEKKEVPAAIHQKTEMQEAGQTAQQKDNTPAQETRFGKDPERPEKNCPKCGAPNDQFVNICWMCKERI